MPHSYHILWLGSILQIKWQDKITNTEVLESANMRYMHAILCGSRGCRSRHKIKCGLHTLTYLRAGRRLTTEWLLKTELQRCMQERHETLQHWHRHVSALVASVDPSWRLAVRQVCSACRRCMELCHHSKDSQTEGGCVYLLLGINRQTKLNCQNI